MVTGLLGNVRALREGHTEPLDPLLVGQATVLQLSRNIHHASTFQLRTEASIYEYIIQHLFRAYA